MDGTIRAMPGLDHNKRISMIAQFRNRYVAIPTIFTTLPGVPYLLCSHDSACRFFFDFTNQLVSIIVERLSLAAPRLSPFPEVANSD